MPAPRSFAFATCDIHHHAPGDGSIVVENRTPLPSPLPDVMDRLDHWAARDGGAVLITEPAATGRRSLPYREAAALSADLATRLATAHVRAGDVVCVVAGAGCDHALLKLACLRGGLVHAPLSPALLRSEPGRARLASMLEILRPSLIVTGMDEPPDLRTVTRSLGARTTSLGGLVSDAPPVEPAVGRISESGSARAHGREPDETAAIYFTSGSTGNAKGVIVTRRMISAVHGAGAAHWPFLTRRRPVMMDWLPWHHVFGGLDNFFKMVWNGGAYHVSAAPAPETIADTVRLAGCVAPTLHVDVPLGLRLLLDRLESDVQSREAFFERLELIFFAGAGLDSQTWARLKRMTGRFADRAPAPPRLASGYGCTEAGSTICLAHEEPSRPDEIGIPLPGHALRLVDVEGRTEARVRGPTVSPGYLGPTGRSPMPLDDEGFLRTGDAVASVLPNRPEHGLRFDGRLAEDFKLSSGTWVRVDGLRRTILGACSPYIADVAIAGDARDSLRALLFPSLEGVRIGERSLAQICELALTRHNAEQPGTSTTIVRAMVMAGPPNPGAGELNDKGHLVQRRCLANRREDVEHLFTVHADSRIVVPGRT